MARFRLVLGVALSAASAVLPTASPSAAEIEEIVVTAQKRAQSLQDVPVAVTAFTADDLNALKITRPIDIGSQTPGLHGKSVFVDEAPVFTIRGIGLNDFAPNTNPTASVYVNEVLVPYLTMLGFQLFDTERVEVLKGPQGTLYGRNNTGGAINFVTRKPERDPDASLRIDYGSFRTIEIEAAGGGPISDTVAGRAAMQWKRRMSGYQRNRLRGGEENGEIDRLAARGMLLWEPTETFNVLVDLHAGRHDDDQPFYNRTSTGAGAFLFEPDGITPVQCAPALAGERDEGVCTSILGTFDPDDDFYVGDFNLVWGDSISDYSGWGSGLTINWELPRFSLTSITGYERFSRNQREDSDQGPLVELEAVFNDDTWVVSEELRLTSDESWSFDWILGLYYYTDSVDGQITIDFRDFLATIYDHNFVQDSESVAVFGHFSWPFADRFRLNGGVRFTYDQKEMNQLVRDLNPFGASFLLDPFGNPGFVGPVSFIDVRGREISETDVSGEVGVDWKPIDDLLLYAKFSKGFKSGGFNGGVPFFPEDAEPFDPEELFAWEGGFKAAFANGALRWNTALYYYDWQDFQAIVGRPGNLLPIDNAGDAEVIGFESELFATPAEGLEAVFGLSYIDSEITKSNPALVLGLDGNQLADTPKWQFNGRLTYTVPLPFWNVHARLGADFSWRDDVFFDVKNVPILTQKDYWLLNTRFSLVPPDERWEIAFWGRNVTNEVYFVERFDFTNIIATSLDMVGFPREVGVSVSYRWD